MLLIDNKAFVIYSCLLSLLVFDHELIYTQWRRHLMARVVPLGMAMGWGGAETKTPTP